MNEDIKEGIAAASGAAGYMAGSKATGSLANMFVRSASTIVPQAKVLSAAVPFLAMAGGVVASRTTYKFVRSRL